MQDALELDSNVGMRINTVCEKAAMLAQEKNQPVHFEFNGTHVTAQPGEPAESLVSRWTTDFEAAAKTYRESPEYAAREVKWAAKAKAADAAHLMESASTEPEMRDAKVPSIRTKEQLSEYIESLTQRSHDYGTCVYAMSMAATAAFNYAAHVLEVTGFQASVAELDVLRRTRGIEGPFMVIKGEDFLYPQCTPEKKLYEAELEWAPWLKEEAAKKLANMEYPVHPDVEAHWRALAGCNLPTEEEVPV